MARKTVEVQTVRERVNVMLEVQNDPNARRAVAILLESVLHSTGNYKGFRYQSTETNDDGTLREGYDDTRRYYY